MILCVMKTAILYFILRAYILTRHYFLRILVSKSSSPLMKLTKQILIILIFIAGLVPLYAGYLAFTDPNKMLDLFHITPMPGMEMTTIYMGLFFLAFAIVYFFDANLLYKRRQAGRSLAMIMGFISLINGIILYSKYKQYNIEAGTTFALADAVKGGLIMLLAWTSKD